MKLFAFFLIFSFSFITTSCSTAAGDSTITISAMANDNNYDNVAGTYLPAQNTLSAIDTNITPVAFYMDIRGIKILDEHNNWFTLKNEVTGYQQNLVNPTTIELYVPVKAGNYTALVVAYGENWYAAGSGFSITNSSSSGTLYAVFGASSNQVNQLISNNPAYATASTGYLQSGLSILSGNSNTLNLYIGSINLVQVHGASYGLNQPYLSIVLN